MTDHGFCILMGGFLSYCKSKAKLPFLAPESTMGEVFLCIDEGKNAGNLTASVGYRTPSRLSVGPLKHLCRSEDKVRCTIDTLLWGPRSVHNMSSCSTMTCNLAPAAPGSKVSLIAPPAPPSGRELLKAPETGCGCWQNGCFCLGPTQCPAGDQQPQSPAKPYFQSFCSSDSFPAAPGLSGAQLSGA